MVITPVYYGRCFVANSELLPSVDLLDLIVVEVAPKTGVELNEHFVKQTSKLVVGLLFVNLRL